MMRLYYVLVNEQQILSVENEALEVLNCSYKSS